MINIDFFIINILTTNTMKTEGKKKKKFLEKEERVTCLRNIGESSSLANCILIRT